MMLKRFNTATIYTIINLTIIGDTCNQVIFGQFKKIKKIILILIFQFLNDSSIIINNDSLYKIE